MKIRKGGKKNRRIQNRKTKNIFKIVSRLLQARLEANMKKEAEEIRKHGKKNRRIEIAEKTIVEARPEDWIRNIKGAKCGKVALETRKSMC